MRQVEKGSQISWLKTWSVQSKGSEQLCTQTFRVNAVFLCVRSKQRKRCQLYPAAGKTALLGFPPGAQLLHWGRAAQCGEISTFPCTWQLKDRNGAFFSLVKYFLGS